MFYPNRQVLGDKLAEKLTQYKDTDSIILCLKKSSLLSCIELAAILHAYIYVLQYVEVDDPYDITRSLGALTQSGEFVLNPDITQSEYEYINTDFRSVIEQRKREAFSAINSMADPNANFDSSTFNGRNVLMHADVLKTSFQIKVAQNVLRTSAPLSVSGACGNITSIVSDKFQMETEGVTYMDILPNTFFDDDHYFDQEDPYTEEEKISMATNISLYWA